jgi:hypothetical protein
MSYVNPTNASGVDAMARQLMVVFDRNRDGKLEASEFTAVLGDLMNRRSVSTADVRNLTGDPVSGAGLSAAKVRSGEQLAGFDARKLEASVSTKYRFARAAMEFDVSTVRDKASAAALLNQMRPTMEREGLQVLDISNDRIHVMHEGQPVWIDVIQGANSGAPMFQWLPTE